MKLLNGKKGVIFGVANSYSIAWAVAQMFHQHGARLAFNFATERLEKNVKKLTESLDGSITLPCDVSDDEAIKRFFEQLDQHGFEELDFLIHSVAYAQREDLGRSFSQTSREGFRVAHDISAYSLTAVVQAAGDRLKKQSSVVTMSYLGAERVVPNYNVMGVAKSALESSVRYLAAELGDRQIRINAISAGPVNTLSARGISEFLDLQKHFAERAPMKRNVTLEEIAGATLFLCSDFSTGISGEVLHVDNGFHIMAM
ncbi:enoyl-ACP reductase [Candidatus Sumerlaeota bacterium]|nr:enoyl-ACP reductase [Candidatus Sumerlaeota bacterium]